MKPKIQRFILRVIPFGIIFYISGLLYTILEQGILGDLDYYPATGLPYDFELSLYFSFSMILVGLVVGTIEVLFMKKLFINRSFAQKILFKTFIYILVNYMFTIVAYPFAASIDLNTSIVDIRVWDRLLVFITSFNYFSVVTYIAVTLIISLLYAEMTANIGHEALKNFFTGKYHRPIEEERIFMFLDMNLSTTIAENLGHVRYFEMLRAYFADLSEPIVQYSGEIYQYVGDEIVISWELNKGLHKNNCIECFYAMKQNLINQADKYSEKFGIVPTFKAGFHLGKVTAGEIGIIKRNIIFTGDVLNTTARIQGLCKTYDVDIIISVDVVNKLDLDADIQIKSLGENKLRGRNENIILYTIDGEVKTNSNSM